MWNTLHHVLCVILILKLYHILSNNLSGQYFMFQAPEEVSLTAKQSAARGQGSVISSYHADW